MEDSSETKTIKRRGPENWALWKFQVRIALMAKEVFGVVTRTSQRPVEPVAVAGVQLTQQSLELYQTKISQWERKEAQAQHLITTSLTESSMLHIMTCGTAKEMWYRLHEVFENKTETSVHMLNQQWYTMGMDPSDHITTHISKVQDLAHRLKTMGENVSDNQISMKILLTLPTTFSHFCTAWESTPQVELWRL